LLRFLDDANRAFAGLLTFLEWELEPLRLAWAIEQTRFESLKQKEAANGFAEVSRVAKSRVFFRHGLSRRWPSVLTRTQAERVIQDHGTTMKLIVYEIPDLEQIYPPLGEVGQVVSLTKAEPSVAVVTQETKPANVKSDAKEKHLFVPPEWKRCATSTATGARSETLFRLALRQASPRRSSVVGKKIIFRGTIPVANILKGIRQC